MDTGRIIKLEADAGDGRTIRFLTAFPALIDGKRSSVVTVTRSHMCEPTTPRCVLAPRICGTPQR